MALAPGQAQWTTWATSSGNLVVTLGGAAINSLYFPELPTPVTILVNGTVIYVAASENPQTIPIPSGATTLTLQATYGFTLYVFASTASFTPVTVDTASSSVVTPATITLDFDTVGCNANNPLAAAVARLPLSVSFTPTGVSVVGEVITTGSYFNIMYGEGPITVPTPADSVAGIGNCFFTSVGLLLPAAGVATNYVPLNAGCVYNSPGELVLCISTPPAGGVANLKVTMTGYVG